MEKGSEAEDHSEAEGQDKAKDHSEAENNSIRHIITEEEMDAVELLAQLKLSDKERAEAREDMARMLTYIDQLNELDTAGTEPLSHILSVTNVFREDVVTNGDGREMALANAPEVRDGAFKVPRTVEVSK